MSMYWICGLGDAKFQRAMQGAQSEVQAQPRAYLEYNPTYGIPMQYWEGMQNNITVECLYCRTQRESRHKTCKGCGATEARRV